MTLPIQIALGIILAVVIMVAVPLIVIYGARLLPFIFKGIGDTLTETVRDSVQDARDFRDAMKWLSRSKQGRQTLFYAVAISCIVVFAITFYLCAWQGACSPL